MDNNEFLSKGPISSFDKYRNFLKLIDFYFVDL